MIHVQNWKIYSSHYDDDSTELGFELKKEQLYYKQYGEQMGVTLFAAHRDLVLMIFSHICLMEPPLRITIKQNLLNRIIIASQLGSGMKG